VDRRFFEIANMNQMGAGRGPVGGPKPKPADDSPALKDYEYNSKCNLINLVCDIFIINY